MGHRTKRSKVVIQGFGNVGSYTAKFLDEYACKIIGVIFWRFIRLKWF